MPLLPRFELTGEAHTATQAGTELTELSVPSASWSGYPASNEDPLIGKTLNETYLVESVLGEGGMGKVYRASHTRISNKRFAIKVLRAEFTRNAEVVARFRREAEAAACISHPNVVEVYDVDVTREGYSYLVCEYLAGLDLADYLAEKGRLEPLRAVNLALQICHALEAAHDSGVIHRDVKPHNIFLLADETGHIPEYPAAKVLDFGLSRFMDSDGSTQLTRAGVIMGTPSYMSPEQAEGKPVDARTDVYGLGAVLFAALAGRPPFEAESLQALIMAVINGAPERLRAINPAIPESLEFIVEHAMARQVGERYQNMQEFRSALEGYFSKMAVSTMPPTSPIRLPAASLVQEPDDDEIAAARPLLVVYGAALTLLVALGIATSVASVEVYTGRLKLTRLESLLLFFGLAGTLATPALLLLGKVKRTVWTSHAKVLGLLTRLRTAVGVSLIAYGGLTLALIVADDVLGRMAPSPLLGHALGVGFRGFNLLLFAVAAIWATLAALKLPLGGKGRRRSTAFVGLTLAAFLTTSLVYGALLLRHRLPEAQDLTAASRPKASAPSPAVTASSKAAPSSAPESAPKIVAAPDAELAKAVRSGALGLQALLESYPNDPNVLRPLFYAYASRGTGLADAMNIAQRLLRASPEDARENDVKFLVRKGALAGGDTARQAFTIMTDSMGTAGADLLYDLYVAEPKVAKQAEELLNSPKVRKVFSPSLAIAYDLRKAKSCAARVPLLERASGLGDRRSVVILSPLSAGSKRGCGRWKRSPCPAVCAEEAKAYLQTIADILERTPGSR